MTTMDPELCCQELVELVTEWMEGALSTADDARLVAHLADCEPCTAYVEQLRLVVAASRLDEGAGPSSATRARLLELFEHAPDDDL